MSALILAAAVSTPLEQTDASWVDREFATTQLSVSTLPAPDFRCASAGAILAGQVNFVWTTPTAPYPGAVLQGYEFSYGLVGGSMTTELIAATAKTAAVPAAALVLLSSYTVTLRARYGNWYTPVTSRTITVLLGALSITVFNCG